MRNDLSATQVSVPAGNPSAMLFSIGNLTLSPLCYLTTNSIFARDEMRGRGRGRGQSGEIVS